jgi:arylsulfatase A-like enzyme
MLLLRKHQVSPPAKPSRPGFAPMQLAAWLALVLVVSKGFSLGRLHDFSWLRDLSMASFVDVLFALGLGTIASLTLRFVGDGSPIASALRGTFIAVCVLCAFYAVVAVGVFNYFGRHLNYDLLNLVQGVGAVQSSISDRLTITIASALIGVPVGYYALCRRLARKHKPPVILISVLLAWSALGCWQYYYAFRPNFMPRLSVNPHIELVRSIWNTLTDAGKPTLQIAYPRHYLDEFQTRSMRQASAPSTWGGNAVVPPKNVIVIVLESVGTRYLSLYGSPYNTTSKLREEAAHALVFENFYAHAPYTFCSFMTLNFSIYPGMPWSYAPGDFSRDGPRPLPQTLASILKQRGARTAYLNNGDLEWAGMGFMLEGQGYDTVEDYRAMGGATLTSWGTEDQKLFDRLIGFIDEKPGQPFYVFCWTDQTHDPYELGTARTFDFFGEEPPSRHADDLGRYLSLLRQLDRQLSDLFQALRDRALADDTLVVITGDHGEAFSDPHYQRGHGFTVYQEDVSVPLVLWNPRLFPGGQRLETIGGHVDLNATIADLLEIPSSQDWQGYSLFAPNRPQRAYFLASVGEYLFGVRDGKWKYTFEATNGREFLADLTIDADELQNVASLEPHVCNELRRRVAAWVDFENKFIRRPD